jgi:hypothetical protein
MVVNKDMSEEGVVEEKGLEDVQPEIGLINWISELFTVVSLLLFRLRSIKLISSGTRIKRHVKLGFRRSLTRSSPNGRVWRWIRTLWTPFSTSTEEAVKALLLRYVIKQSSSSQRQRLMISTKQSWSACSNSAALACLHSC